MPRLVPPTSLQLALLDPEIARELGIVAPDLGEEALGVLTADEGLDGVAERIVPARADVGPPRRPASSEHVMRPRSVSYEDNSLRPHRDHTSGAFRDRYLKDDPHG